MQGYVTHVAEMRRKFYAAQHHFDAREGDKIDKFPFGSDILIRDVRDLLFSFPGSLRIPPGAPKQAARRSSPRTSGRGKLHMCVVTCVVKCPIPRHLNRCAANESARFFRVALRRNSRMRPTKIITIHRFARVASGKSVQHFFCSVLLSPASTAGKLFRRVF